MDKLFVIVCSNVFSLHANLITLDKGLTVTYSFLFFVVRLCYEHISNDNL